MKEKNEERVPTCYELAMIANVMPHTVRQNVKLLLKMVIDQGYEIVKPVSLQLDKEAKYGNRL